MLSIGHYHEEHYVSLEGVITDEAAGDGADAGAAAVPAPAAAAPPAPAGVTGTGGAGHSRCTTSRRDRARGWCAAK